jgi:signal peptidase I
MADDQTTDQPELASGGQASPGPEPGTTAEPAPETTTGTPGTTAGPAADEKRGSKVGKSGRKLLVTVIAAVLLMLLLKIFVVQVYVIPSASMQNTLMVGDRVLVNKLTYDFRGIDRGDIIVFSGAGTWGNLEGQPIAPLPGNPIVRYWDEALATIGLRADTTDYVKRVIGLPGDHVACCTDGNITVNGVQLHESSFIIPATSDDPQAAGPASINKFSITVPPGRLWVMGDNRSDSDDSMLHYTDDDFSLMQSTIPENEVVGRASFVIWPLSQFGDLPIPAVFKQAALNGAPAAASLGLVSIPMIWQWRKRRHRTPQTPPRRAGVSSGTGRCSCLRRSRLSPVSRWRRSDRRPHRPRALGR